MTLRKKLVITVAALAAFCCGSLDADTTGKILGTVRDQTGNVIPHAAATLTNKSTWVKQTAQAEDQGAFAFPVVPVGTLAFARSC